MGADRRQREPRCNPEGDVIPVHRLRTRLRAVLRRDRVAAELDDEIEAHLAEAEAEYAARGVPAEQARRAALRDFGGVARAKESCRDARGFPLIESIAQDARVSARALRKAPVFTAVAVATLALGIGLNTAIFSVADALIARPIPGIERNRVVAVAIGVKAPAAAADYVDWRRQSRSFDELAAYRQRNVNLTGIGAAEHAYAAEVTANFFPVVGASATVGRVFTLDDEGGGEPVVLLSHGFWQRKFGGDPTAVGHRVDVDGRSRLVIGVMARGFEIPMPTDVWLPLTLTPSELARRDALTLRVVGRLKDGITVEQAHAELSALGRQLERAYPATNANRRVRVLPLAEYVQGTLTRAALFLLLGCVGAVLAIACVNIAGLQVARAASRHRESSLRTALGASRWRIAQLTLVENLLIAAMGGAIGAFVGSVFVRLLLQSMPPDIARLIPGFSRIRVDARAVAFVALISTASGALAAFVPAIRTSNSSVNQALKDGRQRLRSVFVVAQIAVALVMLVVGMLFVQGQRDLLLTQEVPAPDEVVVLSVTLPESRYPDARARSSFYAAALEAAASVPGVRTAAVCSTPPLSNNGTTWSRVDIEGQTPPPGAPAAHVVTQSISPEFFQLMQIAIRDGRGFTSADREATLPVAIVSQAMADRYWPGERAVGKRVRMGAEGAAPWLEVVGVAGNVLYDWTQRVPEAVVYRPVAQAPIAASIFAVRAAGDITTILSPLTRRLSIIDPLLPVFNVMSLSDAIDQSFAGTKQIVALMSILGTLAFIIAVVGIYGIVAYTVAARTREFGVRIALGARRADIFSLVMRHALLLSAWGVGLGLAASIGASRLTRGLAFAAASAGPMVGIAIAALLAIATMLACSIPALRATRADPVAALRSE